MSSLDHVTPNEWAVANNLLANAADGTKIKRTSLRKKIKYYHPDTQLEVILRHSFMKINGESYSFASGEILGAGGFGKVKLVKNKQGVTFALKISYEFNPEEANILNDVGVGKAPIVARKNTIQRSKYYYLMEYLGTSFKDYYLANHLTQNTLLDCLLQCAVQVDNLHKGKNSISHTKRLHLDIKPSNFVINDQNKLRLIDFGLSKPLNESGRAFSYAGTTLYRAPEISRTGIATTKSDIYSLGVTFQNLYLHSAYSNPLIASLCCLMQHQNPILRPNLTYVKICILVAQYPDNNLKLAQALAALKIPYSAEKARALAQALLIDHIPCREVAHKIGLIKLPLPAVANSKQELKEKLVKLSDSKLGIFDKTRSSKVIDKADNLHLIHMHLSPD